MRQVALVQRDVLHADDPLVRLELGDAIHEQERIAMREDALDRGVVSEVGACPWWRFQSRESY
jgi:hypothetical protein